MIDDQANGAAARGGEARGRPYQQVVAMVLEAVGPDATAIEGEWVDGPDGRRDRDVTVSYKTDSGVRRVLVECKDYDPSTTGKVGVKEVDAIDSKRHDVSVDAAMICSNAGFSSVAINKASRRGIGLISVMREGDERVRFRVVENMYTRDIQVGEIRLKLKGVALESSTDHRLILYRGVPVDNWVQHRIALTVGANPIVTGPIVATHEFTTPQPFSVDGREVNASGLDFSFHISGQWFSHLVTYDATNGIYDWIRRRVRLGTNRAGAKLTVAGVDPFRGRTENRPPDWLIGGDLVHGELSLLVFLINLDLDGPVSDLSLHIVPSDLDVRMARDAIEALCRSDPEYEDTRHRSNLASRLEPGGPLEISFA